VTAGFDPVRFQILGYEESGPVVTFRTAVVRVGRDEACEICVDDPAVSRVHCAIHVDGAQAMLVVGRSRNPTFVNGVKASNTVLKPGDQISVCDYKLRYDPGAAQEHASGPSTLDHLGSRRKEAEQSSGEPDGADISLELTDIEDPLAQPIGGPAPVAPPPPPPKQAPSGRDEEEHTRVLPRGKPGAAPPAAPAALTAPSAGSGRDEEEHTRVLPRGGGAPPPRQPAPVVAKTGPGREGDEHTRVLPRGAAKPSPRPAQAVVLGGDAAQIGPEQGQLDELDPNRLSVAIQEQSVSDPDKDAPGTIMSKGPLKSNGVRAAMLAMFIAAALLAWKDSLFPAKEVTAAGTYVASSEGPAIVGDRGGRSDEQLLGDAQKSFDIGVKKLEEHHLQDENLTMAIRHLTQSQVTLKLLSSSPPLAEEVDAKLVEAEDLREQKYRDALFHYQKLKRAGAYRECKDELEFIMRLIDDDSDPRHKDAERELVMIEEALKDTR
jgi:hypothetical protein